MKKVFIAAALAVFALSANAQNVADMVQGVEMDSPNNKIYFGLRASFDLTVPSKAGYELGGKDVKQGVFNTGAGFSIGGVVNIPVWRNLYFEPGLNMYYHTVGIKDSYLQEVSDFEKGSLREFGLSVPLNFGYRFDFDGFSIAPFTGPELYLGLSGKQHMSATVGDVDMGGSRSMYGDDGLNRGDVAWRFGVGANISYHYYVGISGAVGMTNWYKTDGVSGRRNQFNLTVGYNF